MSELPNGWVDTTLGEVVDYAVTQKAEPTEIQPNDWILELEDIEKDSSKLLARHTFTERQSKSTKNRFSKGCVLYGKLRPYLNKVLIADDDGYCTTEIIPIKPNEFVDGRFLFYALKRKEFLDYVQEIAHGLNMPRLGTEQGRNAPFRLPPLNEQKRIAAKLDRMLARVDAAKARLDKIPALLKRLRQALLAAATSGKLTEEWREDEAYIEINKTYFAPSNWKLITVRELTSLVTSGSRGWARYYADKGATFIRAQNINSDRLCLDDIAFVSLPTKTEGTRTRVMEGDLLVTITGANVTKSAAVNVDLKEAYVSQHVALVRPCDAGLSSFLELYLWDESSGRGQLLELAYGGGKPGLNLENIKDLKIAVPSAEEQNEIVRRVEELFAIAARIEAQYRTARARVDRLSQSLLAKAFRGELVPQDPNDEPAAVLLERIRAERAAAPKPQRGRRKKPTEAELPMVAEPKRPYRKRKA